MYINVTLVVASLLQENKTQKVPKLWNGNFLFSLNLPKGVTPWLVAWGIRLVFLDLLWRRLQSARLSAGSCCCTVRVDSSISSLPPADNIHLWTRAEETNQSRKDLCLDRGARRSLRARELKGGRRFPSRSAEASVTSFLTDDTSRSSDGTQPCSFSFIFLWFFTHRLYFLCMIAFGASSFYSFLYQKCTNLYLVLNHVNSVYFRKGSFFLVIHEMTENTLHTVFVLGDFF